MQPISHLPDPRRHTAAAQPLNKLAQDLLQQRDMGRMVASEAALDAEILRLLETTDDQALQAALAGASGQVEYRVLHDRLQALLMRHDPAAAGRTTLFAIPLVLVAGSRNEMVIPGELARVDEVKRLLTEQGIFSADADIRLSSHLVERDALLAVAPSQLLQWRGTMQLPADGLPVALPPAPIAFKGDGVYLRYLVGVAVEHGENEPAVKLNAAPGAWSMALAKLLGELLKQDGLTLFPLPRVPLSWLAAIEEGRVAQQEIRFQVFVSNALRDLRQKGETPVAVLSAHENGELRVTLGAATNSEQWSGFIWPLGALDRVEVIQQMMTDLLRECQHEDIRVVADVLPTVKNNVPYFPLPTELPETVVRH